MLISLLAIIMPTSVVARSNDGAFEIDNDMIIEVTIINPVTLTELHNFIASNDVSLDLQINEKMQNVFEEALLSTANEDMYIDSSDMFFEAASFCSHIWVTTGRVTTWATQGGTHQVMLRIVTTNAVNGAVMRMRYRMEACVITVETIQRDVTCQFCGMPSTVTEHTVRHTHC